MGWIDESRPSHEGYVVGFVEADRPGVIRELCYPKDDKPGAKVVRIATKCSCGWSTQPWVPGSAPSYWPFICTVGEADEAKAVNYWKVHLTGLPREVIEPTPVSVGGTDKGHPFIRRDGPEGTRPYLGDDGIHCGEILELDLGEVWLRGRYELEAVGFDVLHIPLNAHREGAPRFAVLRIPQGAYARRPAR